MNTHENYHNTDYNMLLPISTEYATKWAKEQLSFQRIWAYTITGKDLYNCIIFIISSLYFKMNNFSKNFLFFVWN